MRKKIIILSIVVITFFIVLLLIFNSLKLQEHKNDKDINQDIIVESQNIEITNDEVFIEATLKNKSKETIKLNDVEIIVLNSNNKEVLKIKSEVNKTLKQNESVLISSQTKANLDSSKNYNLKIEY